MYELITGVPSRSTRHFGPQNRGTAVPARAAIGHGVRYQPYPAKTGLRTGTIKCPSPAVLRMSGRPLDVLEASLGDRVTVRLKSGDEYVGDLAGYDQHMNLVLEDVTIPVEGNVEEEPPAEDTTIIRGDNVVSITP
ncbi:hypothetical protein JCM9743_23450 [Natrinema sp. JCM 9743]